MSYTTTSNNTYNYNMDLRDYIRVYDIDLPDDFLEEILLDKERNFKQATISHNSIINKSIRNCHNDNIKEDTYEFHRIKSIITTYTKQYIKDTNSAYLDINHYHDGYNIIKYIPGEFYKTHVDCGPLKLRTLSIIILLNDDFQGGELQFFGGKYIVSLKKYSMVIFPSNFLFPHEVKPVISGIRYTIVSWVS